MPRDFLNYSSSLPKVALFLCNCTTYNGGNYRLAMVTVKYNIYLNTKGFKILINHFVQAGGNRALSLTELYQSS